MHATNAAFSEYFEGMYIFKRPICYPITKIWLLASILQVSAALTAQIKPSYTNFLTLPQSTITLLIFLVMSL